MPEQKQEAKVNKRELIVEQSEDWMGITFSISVQSKDMAPALYSLAMI